MALCIQTIKQLNNPNRWRHEHPIRWGFQPQPGRCRQRNPGPRCRAPPRADGQRGGQHHRVVRLFPVRNHVVHYFCQAVLSQRQRAGQPDVGAGHLRAGLSGAPAWGRDLLAHRRPHRPQEDAGDDAVDDGLVDRADGAVAQLRAGGPGRAHHVDAAAPDAGPGVGRRMGRRRVAGRGIFATQKARLLWRRAADWRGVGPGAGQRHHVAA
ncbi:hypothetical protein D3C72_788840 [compost metagenome]